MGQEERGRGDLVGRVHVDGSNPELERAVAGGKLGGELLPELSKPKGRHFKWRFERGRGFLGNESESGTRGRGERCSRLDGNSSRAGNRPALILGGTCNGSSRVRSMSTRREALLDVHKMVRDLFERLKIKEK